MTFTYVSVNVFIYNFNYVKIYVRNAILSMIKITSINAISVVWLDFLLFLWCALISYLTYSISFDGYTKTCCALVHASFTFSLTLTWYKQVGIDAFLLNSVNGSSWQLVGLLSLAWKGYFPPTAEWLGAVTVKLPILQVLQSWIQRQTWNRV